MKSTLSITIRCLGALSIAALGTLQVAAQSPLPESTPEREGFDAHRLNRVEHFVERAVYTGQRTGAASIVARNGKIVHWTTNGFADAERGASMSPDTIFRIYSMSKVITSVAVLQLMEVGALTLDQEATIWLPELANLSVFVGGDAESPITQPATQPGEIWYWVANNKFIFW